MIKVTFCTVCMNRLHHLKITLPKNIKDHQNNDNASFLLLDYNSQDGLEEWVKKNLADEISTGKLVYYKTLEPQAFNRSHSRNLAFKLVKEGLICNLDADNFTGYDFYSYINHLISINDQRILGVDRMNLKGVLKDVVGRICINKEDFDNVKGFDESMTDYGFEDVDLVNRVAASGKELVYMNKKKYLKAIAHSNVERYAEETITKKIMEVLISHLTPQLTDLIFIYNDGTFEKGTLYDNIDYYFKPFTEEMILNRQNYPRYLIQGDWLKGNWELLDKQFNFIFNYGKSFFLVTGKDCFFENGQGNGLVYISVMNDRLLLSQIKEFYSNMNNWKKMIINEDCDKDEVNIGGYGKGTVYRNFSTNPIIVD